MRHVRLLLLASLALSVSACAGEDRGWTADLCSSLVSIEKLRSTSTDREWPEGALRQRIDICEEGEALDHLLTLWHKGFDVEIYWWRESRRGMRALVVALFLCAVNERIGVPEGVPAFDQYTQRFASPERAQRAEEIEYVRSHRAAVAKQLVKVFDARGQKPRGYESYKRAATRAAPDTSSQVPR